MTATLTPTAPPLAERITRKPRLLRAVAYSRISRENGRHGPGFISQEVQDDVNDAMAARHGATIVERFHESNISGGIIDRPALQAAVAMVKAGDADLILVAKVNRYARDTYLGLQVAREIAATGARLVIDDCNGAVADSSVDDENNLMSFTMLLLMAELELKKIKKGWHVATTKAVNRGVYIGHAPLGYTRDADKRLVIDPVVAPLVAGVFKSRAAGASWATIRNEWQAATVGLTIDGKLYPEGQVLRSQRFGSMIASRLYVGELKWEGVVTADHHDAIVTEQTWRAAQPTGANRAVRSPRRAEASLLAGGILKCSGCGRNMTTGTGGTGVAIYKCQKNAITGHKCERPVSVTQSLADAYVVAELRKWAAAEGSEAETSGDTAELVAADEAVEQAQAALAAFYRIVDATDPLAADAIADKQDAIAAAVAHRDGLYASRKVAGVKVDVMGAWDTLNNEQQRVLIAGAIDSVVVHPSRATVERVGPLLPVEQRLAITFRD